MRQWIILAALLASVSTSWAAQKMRAPVRPPATQPLAAVGTNQFAFRLYSQLRSADGNLFFSPFSISTALGMTSEGASAQTLDQMLAVLNAEGFKSKDAAAMHGSYGDLITALNAGGKDRGYQLAVANALWGQKGLAFKPEFFDQSKKFYQAGLSEMDFAGDVEKARIAINAWVEQQTQDKIKELLKPGVLDGNTRLVLTNAIYFKGDWTTPFQKNATADGEFFLSADKKANVPMMHQSGRFGYGETDAVQVLEMPYAKGELSMLVILPKEKAGLAAVEKAMTADTLAAAIGQMRQRDHVQITMPKFKMTSEFSLKDVLTQLGMADAFNPDRADFSGLTDSQKLYISAVVHKAFVDVNEEGTEAAGATGVAVGVKSAAPMDPPPVFTADHPFLFVIRHAQSGAILFMGRVNDPR